MIQPSYIEEVRIAKGEHLDGKMEASNRRVEINKTIRVAIRQGTQENRLDETVDRRSGADAESEREDGDSRESWITPKLARCVAQVGKDAVDQRWTRLLTVALSRLGNAAEAQACLQLGSFRAHALSAEFGSGHIEMRSEFVIDVSCGTTALSAE